MKKILILVLMTSLAACKGGGGSSSVKSGGGVGNISVSQGANLGLSCMGYELNSNNCQNIFGTWTSTAVPAVYGCVGATNALVGTCNIEGKVFTALTSTPYSNEAIDVCESFGGSITPSTAGTCTSAGGSWEVTTQATTTFACNKTPSNQSECDGVGGVYGNLDRLIGRATPQYNSNLPVGVNTLQTGEDTLNGFGFKPGSRIAAVTGNITLSNVYGQTTNFWRKAASVTRSGDFYNNRYDDTLDFNLNFGESYLYDDYRNGAYLDLTIFYIKD